MKKSILVITLFLASLSNLFASHIPGGNLTWQCTGNPNEYIVTMQLFVSCPSTLSASYTGDITNTCGLANPTLTMPQVGVDQEVSQICSSQLNLSDCPPGTGGIPGVMMYTYQATVTLPAGCNSWDFAFELCCRDASLNTNGGTGNYMYFHSGMNSITAPCDGSPYVTAQPIPYVCAGQQQTYCPGAIDPDGDNLTYTLVNPLGQNATAMTHPVPYSPTAPLQNLVMDPITGCITFNQPTIGNFVVTYLIEAYNTAGQLTGFIYHDFQFEVINNVNCQPPVGPGAGGVTNLTGNATLLNPNTIEVCEGQSMCFDISFSDPEPLDTLTLDSTNTNVFTALPGATLTQVGTNPVTFTICWTVPAGASPNTQFTIGVSDGSCPIENLASYPVNVNVINSTVAPPDMTICGGQVAPLSAVGGTIFNWSVLAGPPIVVGTNFSCNPCANPIATPAATTTYLVTSNLSGGCMNTDTVTVNVVPDFSFTISQSSSSACLFEPIQLDAIATPAAPGYTYSWTPSTFLSADTISNPIANITVPGTYTYSLDVTSPGGCVKTNSITITITPFVAPTITILTPDSLMACGDSILIDLDLGGGIPALCGPSPTNTCSGPPTNTSVGTPAGANSTTSYPAPYSNWYRNAKHQFLYTAAELNAMGIMGGKITEIAWEITQINGTTTYNSYEMKMGCTSTTNLNTWETGLTQVLNPVNVNVLVGMNVHVLDVAYEWDGLSNLVIEICYDNLATSYTNNSITPWTTTTFTSSIWYRSDSQLACPSTTSTGTGSNRPVTRFTWCPTTPDPLAFNYSWTPNTSIITSTMQNPTVFPSTPTTYVVTVTDIAGNCSDTDSINVIVACGACYHPSIATTNPICKDGTAGKIIIDPTFVLGSEVQTFTWKDSITNVVLQTTPNLTAGMQDSLVNIGAGAYTIIMIDSSGCSKDTTIWLYEPDSVVINTITTNNTICIGGNMQISATATDGNGGPYTYTWTDMNTSVVIPGNGPHTVNPIDTFTCYSVFATDPLGCISSLDSVCITLFDSITATSLIANTTNDSLIICPNTNQDIDIVATGGMGAPYTYTWYQNNVQIGTGSLINVTPSVPSTYIGVAYDNCTTPADSVIIFIDWYGLVIPSITRNKPDSCYPFTVEFTNTSSPQSLVDGALTQWTITNGDNLIGDIVSSTFDTPVCQDLTLTVTTIEGCIVDTTYIDYICPFDYPIADFIADPDVTDILDTEVDFTNQSSGVAPMSFLWNFNSGLNPDSSIVKDPIFTFPNIVPDDYIVNLQVTDNNGCVSEISHTIIINGVYLFYVPNSFTPGGDGTNDVFRPSGEGIDLTQYTMQIFDRWGELIFSTTDATDGWDGTYKGSPVPAGTYIWKIDTKEEDNSRQHKNYGHVNLIK